MRGWRLFLFVPALGILVALSLGLLMKMGLLSAGTGGWVLGFFLFAVLPALTGSLYGARAQGWAPAAFGGWPSVIVTMVALAGFGGAADLMTSLYAPAILALAASAGLLTRLALRLRL